MNLKPFDAIKSLLKMKKDLLFFLPKPKKNSCYEHFYNLLSILNLEILKISYKMSCLWFFPLVQQSVAFWPSLSLESVNNGVVLVFVALVSPGHFTR